MLSLRKAFPEELGSLYIAEEFKADNEDARPPVGVTPASVVPLPPTVPPVNQVPATPTTAPRPTEVPKFAKAIDNLPARSAVEVQSEQKVEADTKALAAALAVVTGNTPTPEPTQPSAPQPDTAAIEAVKKAVPNLQPAATLPEPKKRGPKPKNPDNGRKVETEVPEINQEENQEQTEEFSAEIDPTPTEDDQEGNLQARGTVHQKGFNVRVRKLVDKGSVGTNLKNFILNASKKNDPKQLTVANWNESLAQLELLTNEELVAQTKAAPLPEF
jgi:hypothetical protein